MAIEQSHPMRMTPTGLVDAYDATAKFPGACRQLTNLVFDSSNPELAVSRPGVIQLASFANGGFTTPGFISVHVGLGTRVYGMIASGRNAGLDEPFCFDTATSNFVTISGVTSANCPTSPTTSGDWTPPTMANIGTMIIVTHPGFPGTAGKFFGIIDITTPATPAWSTANTVTTVLPSIPVAVANFNNRAWFACANRVYYTDVLTNPPTITNATQFLVVGDATNINALVGLPIQTTSSGVIQALTVFKKNQCWQITGDTTTNNLRLDYLSLTVGTQSPRSAVQSPLGIYFSYQGGPYVIDVLGTPRAVTHSLQETESDIRTPFVNATTPTRWAGAYNTSIYRVCGPTVVNGFAGTNDYWFDEHRRRWNGPHTFSYDCASQVGGFFVLSSASYPGILIRSEAAQTQGFTFTDLGTPIVPIMLTSTFPKVGDMFRKEVAESQIELGAISGNVTYDITAQDEQGATIGHCIIAVTPLGEPWGYFYWGDGTLWTANNLWGGGGVWGTLAQGGTGGIWGQGVQSIPRTYPVPWTQPLIFEKMALQITVNPIGVCAIGTFYARYQKTGYMQRRTRATP